MNFNTSVSKCSLHQLETLDENVPASSCLPPPETPTESMEFLARSWSLSATELSKALHNNDASTSSAMEMRLLRNSDQFNTKGFTASKDSLSNRRYPQISPNESSETKDLLLLHQTLSTEFISSQNLLRNGLYRSLMRGKTTGRWLKDQKERKKQEIRTHNAQLHAAVSVVGVAAAVAAVAASIASSEKPNAMASAAVASAASLVASHCIEIAEDMGAEQDQIVTAVDSAINAKTNGDIMTLTAGAATALRGAATLKARLERGIGATTIPPVEEKCGEAKEAYILTTLDFVFRGGVLLKRTRKGVLHWKQVSFNINSSFQVVAKMKSKHIAGRFTKKKKYIVTGVCSDIPAWPGREKEDNCEKRAYFGIKTADRSIEFECERKGDKLLWLEGIQYMLSCRAKVTY
ncbi:VAN3-binding protein [Lathyrus oleraceus]|uniref:PH domain-containing protein n=1 Tax=Pisum sativum TaxID=3888 RepID=A0A9D4WK47_PEA|nr:VAN3-binding protein [Pisum sativum]KAI5403290.1 hypothetical protein KIW84_050743 [Pisum sativum]